MKKLMTVLASAATALFAHGVVADLTTTGTSVEGGTPGANLNTAVKDVDGTDEYVYWYMATTDVDNGVVYSNYVGEATKSTPIATRPEKFKDDVNTTFLSLDTSSPLYRTALPNTQNPSGFSGATIGTNGIYLDTLVKFTAADDVFGDEALSNGVDKIAISYVEQGDDVANPITNFVIRAGYIGSEVIETNYIAAVPAGFKKDDWHRLTVRTIANIDGAEKGHVGFVVYIDQVPLTYATSVVCGENFESSGLAEEFYTDELHALYPSAVDTNLDNYNKIAAASFSGTGAIDDVVFTTTPPEFIDVDPDVTVKWDAHVATLKLNGSDVVGFVAGTAGSAKITPVEGVVTVAATFAAGWEYGACETDGAGAWDASTKQFTGLAAGETCNIVGMKPLFDVGGVHYASIEDEALLAALAAGTEGTPATLTLLDNVDTPIEVTEGYIILDLAGKTITDAEDGEGQTTGYAISNAGANLTIINSTETIGHVVASEGGAAVALTAEGLTTITAGIFDSVFDGQGEGNLVITGGTFYDEEYDGETVTGFYLAEYVSGATPAYIGEQYFQVGEGGEQTTYALTIPAVKIGEVTAATATVTADEETISDFSAIPAGTVVTVTWTAANGYKITDGATETITMSENKTATAPTVQPITYATLTITPVNNCTIVVSNATAEVASGTTFDVDDNVTLTVYRTPAEGFKLADGCAATEEIVMSDNRTVTASVVQDGEKTYPSYIDDHAAYQDAYDTWKDANSVADGDNKYEAAFLLNIAPAEEDPELEPASVTLVDGKVVITANQNLKAVNGKVYVKTATTLAGLASAEWAEATVDKTTDTGAVKVTPGESDTAGFYKIKVDF